MGAHRCILIDAVHSLSVDRLEFLLDGAVEVALFSAIGSPRVVAGKSDDEYATHCGCGVVCSFGSGSCVFGDVL